MKVLSSLFGLSLLPLLVIAQDAAAAKKHIADEGIFKTQDMICHGSDNCYPRIFVPTDEFQLVQPDQIIPPGLHVKMDFESGLHWAKFPNKNDKATPESYSVEIKKEDAKKTVVAVGKEDKAEPVKPNKKLSQGDRARFNGALEVIVDNTKSLEEMKTALATLAEVTHEIEYGVDTMKTASTVEKLLSIVGDSKYNSELRENAAMVIGNALQNNVAAVKTASRLTSSKTGDSLNIASALLRSLVDEKDAKVQKRIMYALARAIRVPGRREDFVNKDGLETLRILFSKSSDPTLKGKIAAFVEDEFLNEDMLNDDERTPQFKVGQPNRENVLSVINVPEELVKWCPTLQKNLNNAEKYQDMAEKVLRTLTLIKEKSGVECRGEASTLKWLDTQLKKVDASDEEDGYVVVMKDAKKVFFSSKI